jgi:hypothetical protein
MEDEIFGLMNRTTVKADGGVPRSLGSLVEDGFEKSSVVNPAGSQYKLGKNAVWVWKTCDGRRTREYLTKAYAKEFNIGPTEAQTASEAILTNLERMGLISNVLR